MSDLQSDGPWDGDPDVLLDRPERTGLPRVDAVVDAVADVGSVPLPEHVRVFEQGHSELRAVLDDPDAADPA
jgi:hypothetical protein